MSPPDLSGDRFLVITDEDRRGKLLVIAIICCIYCPLILCLRAVGSLKNIGLNDILAIVAIVTGVMQYATIFAAVGYGLGSAFQNINAADTGSLGRLLYVSQILYLITLALTKCAVVVLCRRLFDVVKKGSIFICDCAAALCVVWGLGAVLVLTIDCSPAQTLGFTASFCQNLAVRWTGVAVTDAMTEMMIFLLAVIVVAPLQMRKIRKAHALAAFTPRLFIIVIAGLHARSVHRQVDSSASGTNLTNPAIYRQVQLIYAITAAATPALNSSLRLFHGNMGNNWMRTTALYSAGNSTSKATSSGNRKQSDIALNSLARADRSAEMSPKRYIAPSKDFTSRLRPDPVNYQFAASGTPSGDLDARSGRSQESTHSRAGIIRKVLHWTISHEESNLT